VHASPEAAPTPRFRRLHQLGTQRIPLNVPQIWWLSPVHLGAGVQRNHPTTFGHLTCFKEPSR
jgi:hypothetical protein